VIQKLFPNLAQLLAKHPYQFCAEITLEGQHPQAVQLLYYKIFQLKDMLFPFLLLLGKSKADALHLYSDKDDTSIVSKALA